MTEPIGIETLRKLREEFDRSFATLPEPPPVLEDLLEVVTGTLTCVLRLRELRAINAGVRVTPLPTPVPELIGVAEFRGDALPVYDLGALLGRPAGAHGNRIDIAIAAARPVALAFDRTGRHHRAGARDILPCVGEGTSMPHVREMLHVDGVVRPIVSLASLVADIERRAEPRPSPEDHTRR
ncbi:MAG TPA: chemotaxis protein CheW [Vicinamibacterales bacterium]